MTLPAQLSGVETLIDLVAAAVKSPADRVEYLKQLFQTTLAQYRPMPCPSVQNKNLTPLTAGMGYTYEFTTNITPFDYALTVVKVAAGGDTLVFSQKKNFAAGAALTFSIPAKIGMTANDTFAVNSDYMFVIYPLVSIGGVDIPFGCVQQQMKSTAGNSLHEIVFAALSAGCGEGR